MCSYLTAWSSVLDAAFDGTSVLIPLHKADTFGSVRTPGIYKALNVCMNATPNLVASFEGVRSGFKIIVVEETKRPRSRQVSLKLYFSCIVVFLLDL